MTPTCGWLLKGAPFALALSLASAPVLAQSGDAGDRPPVPSVMADLAAESLLLDLAWAGAERLIAVGERGHILVSDDRGRSWRQMPSPVSTTLTAARFVDAERGWAVGHDAVVLSTTDGGWTWRIVYRDPGFEAPFLDVLTSADGSITATGAYGLYAEAAGPGAAWSDRFLDGVDFHFNAITPTPEGTLLIAGEFGEILESADGGATWNAVPSPYDGSYFGAVASAEWTAVFGLQGHVFVRPATGGAWQPVATGSTVGLMDGTVLPDGRLAVVGLSGTILVGDPLTGTLTRHQLPDREALADIAVAPDGAVILVGERGVMRFESLDALGTAG